MYPSSTQKKIWTFDSMDRLNELHHRQNQLFQEEHGQNMDLEQKEEYFLSTSDERLLLQHYEIYLNDFCRSFEPMMPKSVVGTAFHYFKRFFLHNSVMNYHPKEILYTVVYLACKIEEFIVSIEQFVNNIKDDYRNKAKDIIISNELFVIQQLNHNLFIHNPYRPIEGFFIDIKTRTNMANPERMRPHIDGFVEKMFFTDACLLYPPSQIALSTILHAASREQENLDSYVTDTLLKDAGEHLPKLVEAIRNIRLMVKQYQIPPRDKVEAIEKKLEKCRNQANNPDSEVYKERMRKINSIFENIADNSDNIAASSANMSSLNTSKK